MLAHRNERWSRESRERFYTLARDRGPIELQMVRGELLLLCGDSLLLPKESRERQRFSSERWDGFLGCLGFLW